MTDTRDTSDQPAPSPAAASSRGPGWDAMTEDMFGLNIRGVRTIAVLFSAPKRVFTAARDANWQDRRYTPSLRLFISLITLALLLQVFWAGPDSHTSKLQLGALEESIAQSMPAELLPFVSADDMWKTIILALPVSTLSVTFLIALLTRLWGKGTNTVTRVRLYFAAIIPGWIVSFSIAIGAEAFSYTSGIFLIMLTPLIVLFVDGSTLWRGNAGNYSGRARMWRSVAFAGINLLAYTIAAIVMAVYASAFVTFQATQAAKAAGVVLTGT